MRSRKRIEKKEVGNVDCDCTFDSLRQNFRSAYTRIHLEVLLNIDDHVYADLEIEVLGKDDLQIVFALAANNNNNNAAIAPMKI